ncbi:MAG: ATP-dependent DNA helicase [Aeropyrum sp.]|nr:ATP-dependent DNA helicase [Aeropyrum sp.]
MSKAVFPYESWRKGQREIAEEVRRAVDTRDIMVLSAPTGFGKTAAVIYGLLSSSADKILYLVRTVNELDPVVRELKRFRAEFTLLFSARRMCPLMTSPGSLPSVEDFWGNCRLARVKGVCDYYSNLMTIDPSVVRQHLSSHPGISAYRIAWDLAKFKKLCPFFAFRSLVDDSMFIVATYPYFFKEDVFQSFLEPYSPEDFVVVVDEAHSLLNAHTLLEYRVSKRDFENSIREIEEYAPSATSLASGLREISQIIMGISAPRIRLADKKPFLERLGDIEVVSDVVELIRMKKAEEALMSLGPQGLGRIKTHLSKIQAWMQVLVRDDSYLFAEEDERGNLWLIATPLDPSSVVSASLSRVKAAILMSGTMPPGGMVRSVLGINRNVKHVEASIAFGVTSYGSYVVTVVSDVTTAFKHRDDRMYRLIASRLATIHRGLPGLKLAVYPSYEVMYRVIERLPSEFELIVESKSTSLEEVESFLLSREPGEAILVNAVAGGKLVEGVEFIDYEGNNLLKVVAVVGIPFPQPDDYTKTHLKVIAGRIGPTTARKLVYLVGPMIKVRQALGRAIRRPEDRAAFFLLDYRYLRKDIKRTLDMPVHYVTRGSGELEEVVASVRKILGG